MTNRTGQQKLARRLQRVAEDELGKRPALMTCHNIVRDDSAKVRQPGDKSEEIAVRLFELRRDVLLASAERKEAKDAER